MCGLYACDGILFNLIKEENPDTCYNTKDMFCLCELPTGVKCIEIESRMEVVEKDNGSCVEFHFRKMKSL